MDEVEGRVCDEEEHVGWCKVMDRCSNAPFWQLIAETALDLSAEFVDKTEEEDGEERWAKGSGFIVSDRGCICSVCGSESAVEGLNMEGEGGGESNMLPSEEGGLAQLPSPCM
ncbi:hypothetical protein chiPu_0000635 [Chiloscyllium punctatum]|uniref:Uncharacterized protein n=1 Tax=Chiloscyllium punctatum TaxID=137246 RepID=A0A401RVR6_CHIPU|nr:hypothetical protein [Chiloscyllium punctatum]